MLRFFAQTLNCSFYWILFYKKWEKNRVHRSSILSSQSTNFTLKIKLKKGQIWIIRTLNAYIAFPSFPFQGLIPFSWQVEYNIQKAKSLGKYMVQWKLSCIIPKYSKARTLAKTNCINYQIYCTILCKTEKIFLNKTATSAIFSCNT